jgi:hypothetical protein
LIYFPREGTNFRVLVKLSFIEWIFGKDVDKDGRDTTPSQKFILSFMA